MTGARAGGWLDGAGTHWRVWAPEHERIEVALYDPAAADDREIARMTLSAEPGGWFSATSNTTMAGTLYKFWIDGRGPFADPASRSQPRGVHGPSEIIDERFAWTDAHWPGVRLEDLVIYEVHVGAATAAGTFDALIPHLGELRSLGVTALELMPLASFPGARNWGYDGVSLFAPFAPYGGPSGLRRFIDRAHAEGLAVLIDCVYNHVGPDGNFLREYSERYLTAEHKTPWGDAIHVDGDPEVREFVLANVEMWIRDYHADGLRLDAT